MAFSASAQYKPEPLKRSKARKKRVKGKARAECRTVAYAKAEGCCCQCGRPLYFSPKDEGADWYNVANVNEIVPRSRGGSSTDPDNANVKCAQCHTGKGWHDHG